MDATTNDPYAVLLKRHKLPMGLLADGNIKKGRVDLLRAESYKSTFGSKSQRKRPKLDASVRRAPNPVPRRPGTIQLRRTSRAPGRVRWSGDSSAERGRQVQSGGRLEHPA